MPKYSTIDFSLIKGNPSKIADKILPFIFFPRFYDLFSLLPHSLCTDSARLQLISLVPNINFHFIVFLPLNFCNFQPFHFRCGIQQKSSTQQHIFIRSLDKFERYVEISQHIVITQLASIKKLINCYVRFLIGLIQQHLRVAPKQENGCLKVVSS